jgi:hypothetical protein
MLIASERKGFTGMSFARENIRALVCGFPKRVRGGRCMVILQGFVDDSGSSDGNVFALAGFLSTAERWEQFSDEYEKICDREPKTPKFKMRHANNPRLSPRVKELVELTSNRAMYRIDAVTARPNYESIVRGNLPTEIDNIYFVLFFNVILATCRLMDLENLEGTVDFVFDNQGSTIEAECVRWYHWIKGHPMIDSEARKRMGSTPIFRDDDLVLPLKSADIWAWQIRRHLNEEQPKKIPHNEFVESILAMRGVSCHVTPEDLQALVYSIQHGLSLSAHCTFSLPDHKPRNGELDDKKKK